MARNDSRIVNELSRKLGRPQSDADGSPHVSVGGDYSFCCPMCISRSRSKTRDTKYKLMINIGKGIYHCYRCKASGSLHDLIDIKIGMAASAVDRAAVRPPSGMPSHSTEIVRTGDKWKWLSSRRKIGRGIDPVYDWDGTPWAKGLFMESLGMPWHIILVFPNSDYWLAYATIKEIEPKTINETGKKIVYNPRILKDVDDLWLVEGPMDCLSCPNSVASLGKEYWPGLGRALLDIGFSRLVICLDGGELESTVEMAVKLSRNGINSNRIFYCLLPNGYDPNDVGSSSVEMAEYMNSSCDGLIHPMHTLPIIRRMPRMAIPEVDYDKS